MFLDIKAISGPYDVCISNFLGLWQYVFLKGLGALNVLGMY